MAGIKVKFDSLVLSYNYPPVNITSRSSSSVVSDEVIHDTSSLKLKNVFFIPKFPTGLLSISQPTKNANYSTTFFPSYLSFRTFNLG